MYPNVWLTNIISAFLGISVLFYCVFAGADFGAGILEFFLDKKNRSAQRDLINGAMGPVWEANHIWIILGVVILFNAFPRAFTQITLSFHLPLTLMLIGIVLRGCAFTFRHYDAVHDSSQKYYSAIFMTSSLITPFILGVIAGGLTLGHVNPDAQDYYSLFIEPWLNLFSFAVGIFVCVLFTYLASVYIQGETQNKTLRNIFEKRAFYAKCVAILAGLLVFIAAEWDGLHLFQSFFHDQWSVLAMTLATLILYPLGISLKKNKDSLSRFFVALQMTLILFGWFKIQFPTLVTFSQTTHASDSLTVYNTAAPEITLRYLLYALLGGSALIFPALFYLLSLFKTNPKESS